MDYKDSEQMFDDVYACYANFLSKEASANVDHYYESGELEMAYESFVLSIIEEGITISNGQKKILVDLGLSLGMDKESVFKADFWNIAYPMLAIE